MAIAESGGQIGSIQTGNRPGRILGIKDHYPPQEQVLHDLQTPILAEISSDLSPLEAFETLFDGVKQRQTLLIAAAHLGGMGRDLPQLKILMKENPDISSHRVYQNAILDVQILPPDYNGNDEIHIKYANSENALTDTADFTLSTWRKGSKGAMNRHINALSEGDIPGGFGLGYAGIQALADLNDYKVFVGGEWQITREVVDESSVTRTVYTEDILRNPRFHQRIRQTIDRGIKWDFDLKVSRYENGELVLSVPAWGVDKKGERYIRSSDYFVGEDGNFQLDSDAREARQAQYPETLSAYVVFDSLAKGKSLLPLFPDVWSQQ